MADLSAIPLADIRVADKSAELRLNGYSDRQIVDQGQSTSVTIMLPPQNLLNKYQLAEPGFKVARTSLASVRPVSALISKYCVCNEIKRLIF